MRKKTIEAEIFGDCEAAKKAAAKFYLAAIERGLADSGMSEREQAAVVGYIIEEISKQNA